MLKMQICVTRPQCVKLVRFATGRSTQSQRNFLVNLEVPDEGFAEHCVRYELGVKGDNRLQPNALLGLPL